MTRQQARELRLKEAILLIKADLKDGKTAREIASNFDVAEGFVNEINEGIFG